MFIGLTEDRTGKLIMLNVNHIKAYYQIGQTTFIEIDLQKGPLYVKEHYNVVGQRIHEEREKFYNA